MSAVAETLRGAQRSMTGSTAMGDAMVEGMASFDRAPCEPVRKVIDVSGDGRNNDGSIAPDDVRVRAHARGITINGLPIRGDEPDVADYYRDPRRHGGRLRHRGQELRRFRRGDPLQAADGDQRALISGEWRMASRPT